MADYSQYSYKHLLEHLEEKGTQYSNRRNYAEYLLSMEHAETIESLIKIYNNIFKLMAILFYGTNKMPSNWYVVETWGYNNKFLLEELNDCFNQNLLVLYKRIKSPTLQQLYTFIANLKDSNNYSDIEEQIIKFTNLDIIKESNRIAGIKNSILCLSNRTSNYNLSDDNYRRQAINAFKILGYNERIFDVREISFAKKHDIDYINIVAQYKEEENARLEEVKSYQRRLKTARVILSLVLLCSIIVTVISIYYELVRLAVVTSCIAFCSIFILIMSHEENTVLIKRGKSLNKIYKDKEKDDDAINNAINDVGEVAISFVLTLPLALLGGIIGNMGKRR